jgi:DHA1 family multidrug resistance protein-like MFS transporter
VRLANQSGIDHIGYRGLLGLPVALWSMLLNSFLMSVGFFMLIPLVSVHYTRSLGFAAASVGLALAVRQFSQQGMMLLTGSIAERVGYRPMLALGMLVRAAGFATFVVADTLPRLLVSSFIAAIGGAFFEVSARSLVAVMVPPEQRTVGFSLWSLSGNVGLAIGPLLGAILIKTSFATVCLTSSVMYVVGASSTLLLIPATAQPRDRLARPPGLMKTVGTVVQDRTFVLFSAIMCGYYLLGTQLYITVPLEAERLTGTTDTLGLLYLVNSVVAVALQFPLVRLANRYLSATQAIVVGTAALALSLASIAFADGVALLLLSVAGIAAARVVIEPVVNASVASIASAAGSGMLASYFGFGALSVAFGASAGQLLGGWLFDQARARDLPAMPWITLGLIGLAVSLALLLFSRSPGARRLDPTTASAQA